MVCKTGREFELAIFGKFSERDLCERFGVGQSDFTKDLQKIIKKAEKPYPETKIGKSFYSLVQLELSRFGLNTSKFAFLSTVDTKVDLRHYTDGFFYLPSVPRFPVTIDAFNLDPEAFFALKSKWLDDSNLCYYSEEELQTDLFRFKEGLTAFNRENGQAFAPPTSQDFRIFSESGRPENHFILTPYHALTYEGRRKFAKIVAGYLARVSGQIGPFEA